MTECQWGWRGLPLRPGKGGDPSGLPYSRGRGRLRCHDFAKTVPGSLADALMRTSPER
jgi:hypothetical protein